MGLLSKTESNLHYKNEAKIDDAIRYNSYCTNTLYIKVTAHCRYSFDSLMKLLGGGGDIHV